MGLIKRYESEIYGNYKKYWFIYGLYTGLIMCFSILFRYWLVSIVFSRREEDIHSFAQENSKDFSDTKRKLMFIFQNDCYILYCTYI